MESFESKSEVIWLTQVNCAGQNGKMFTKNFEVFPLVF